MLLTVREVAELTGRPGRNVYPNRVRIYPELGTGKPG